MNLFLYSGGSREQNHKLNLELVKVLPLDSAITYIPSSSDKSREHFDHFKEWFGYYGYESFKFFSLNEEFSSELIPSLTRSDAIYLAGGNPFNFLYSIRKRGFVSILKKFAKSGKVLIGLSAGSYIMTPTIRLTKEYHEYKGDFEELNQGEIERFNSLGLVEFEVIPHYNLKKKFVSEIVRRKGRDIYGICDGGGIIVKDAEIKLIGKVEKIC